MDTEIADRIERGLGEGPEPRVRLEELLAEGHRAVRRRRVLATAASAAAALVVAGVVAVAGGGGPGRSTPPVADDPSPTAAPQPTVSAPAGPDGDVAHDRVDGKSLAQYDSETGELEVDLGTTVLRRVDNPYDVAPPAQSVALALLDTDGREWWIALYQAAPNSGAGAQTPADHARTGFDTWVRQQAGMTSTAEGTTGLPDGFTPLGIAADMVAFVGATERLSSGDAVTILEQRPGVDLGDSFAGPDDRTAVALVRTGGGNTYYVLARVVDGEELEDIAVPRAKGGRDLDAFVDLARAQYADGAGLL